MVSSRAQRQGFRLRYPPETKDEVFGPEPIIAIKQLSTNKALISPPNRLPTGTVSVLQ